MADIKNSYIRPKKEDTIVYGRIVSASTEGVVADAGQIYDEQLKIGQHELNKRIIKSGIGSFAGIPTYTQDIIDNIDPSDIPDKYILIADKESDLNTKPSRSLGKWYVCRHFIFCHKSIIERSGKNKEYVQIWTKFIYG